MIKKLLFKNEKRLNINLIEMISSVLLSYILYLIGLRSSLNYWVVVFVCCVFLAKAIFAAYRIVKYSNIPKKK